jgi:hypothetical protein
MQSVYKTSDVSLIQSKEVNHKMKAEKYGEWAFLAGIILAVILGIGSNFIDGGVMPAIWALLGLFGIVVGLLNIKDKEINSFLLATIALLAVGTSISPITAVLVGVPGGPVLIRSIGGFLSALMMFIAPAAFIVALKVVYNLAKMD